MDLSDPKTWIDGVAVVSGAPHIVVPLVAGALWVGWWLRERFVDKPMIMGQQQRLEGAKEHQQYLARRLDDAQAEIAKSLSENISEDYKAFGA